MLNVEESDGPKAWREATPDHRCITKNFLMLTASIFLLNRLAVVCRCKPRCMQISKIVTMFLDSPSWRSSSLPSAIHESSASSWASTFTARTCAPPQLIINAHKTVYKLTMDVFRSMSNAGERHWQEALPKNSGVLWRGNHGAHSEI